MAAALLAPGIPSNTDAKVSAVVEAATVAMINIIAEYSFGKIYIKLYNTTSPVVAPAEGTIPTSNPYSVPNSNSIMAYKLLEIYHYEFHAEST